MTTFVALLSYTSYVMRLLYTIILSILSVACMSAQSLSTGVSPKEEVRAVWLTTIGGIDWPHSYAQSERSISKQKDELRRILDKLQATGINTVLLQTRIRGTVIYPSAYEPWDGCLSGFPGKSPGYDALKFAVDECHSRGMELHAWIVTMPIGRWDALGCKQLRQRQPGNIIKIKNEGFMNPESQQTANYLADICEEVTRGYDIDGIHLDYIRYPEELPKLKTMPRERGREYISRIVRCISRRVKDIKPWVKMSCSPIGKYDDTSRYWSHGWNAYTTVCQDAAGWLRDGLMDELFPMMYFRDNNFFPFAIDWKEQSHGRIVVPGLGIYFMSPKERNWPLTDITRELEVLRQMGMGHAYFRSKFFTDDTKGLYRFVKDEYCRYLSLVPPMTWIKSRKPKAPKMLSRLSAGDGVARLQWQHEETDTTQMLFNVYASSCYPVDTDDARNLVAIRRQSRFIMVPDDNLHYAVTATDRYGNESAPAQETAKLRQTSCSNKDKMLACDGTAVEIPVPTLLSDTKYLVIETLQGGSVALLPYSPYMRNACVTDVADGIYQLRSLNSKGTSHRLGIFIIKRR